MTSAGADGRRTKRVRPHYAARSRALVWTGATLLFVAALQLGFGLLHLAPFGPIVLLGITLLMWCWARTLRP